VRKLTGAAADGKKVFLESGDNPNNNSWDFTWLSD